MRITQWGEYGISCAASIAAQEKAGRQAVTASNIADFQSIALDYAQQILQRLRRKDLIRSIRGPQGGYHLSRPASQISLYEILIATEGDTFIATCNSAPLHRQLQVGVFDLDLRPLWFALKQHIDDFLKRYTLEHVAMNTTGFSTIAPESVPPSVVEAGPGSIDEAMKPLV